MTSNPPKATPVAIKLAHPGCLHCVVTYSIGLWAVTYAPKIGGVPAIAPSDIAANLAQVTADFIGAIPDAVERIAAQEYARRALDAAFAAREAEVPAAQSGVAPACASSAVH
uniref:Regenerating islet-derived 1 alpha (Pancreatic stone protein, pancreatic thread protein)-like protein n=1 Tax=Rhodopseudomonas palustris (strain DX-1) TaxID=652103 RepID=E6VFI9_RHOPX